MIMKLKDGSELGIMQIFNSMVPTDPYGPFTIKIGDCGDPTGTMKWINENFTTDNISDVTVYMEKEVNGTTEKIPVKFNFTELLSVNYSMCIQDSTLEIRLK